MAANLAYADAAEATQRMSFVRDGYGYDRKTSYDNEAALLSSRFGSGMLRYYFSSFCHLTGCFPSSTPVPTAHTSQPYRIARGACVQACPYVCLGP